MRWFLGRRSVAVSYSAISSRWRSLDEDCVKALQCWRPAARPRVASARVRAGVTGPASMCVLPPPRRAARPHPSCAVLHVPVL